MTPTFFQNAKPLQHAHLVFRAVTEISMRCCIVLQVNSKSQSEMPSIELDRPLQGIETKITQHGTRRFASGEFMGCRVYWEVAQEAAA